MQVQCGHCGKQADYVETVGVCEGCGRQLNLLSGSDSALDTKTVGNRENRWRWLILVVSIAIVLAGVTVAVLLAPLFRNWHNPPVLAVPPEDEVVEVRACLFASQNGTFPVETIPEFVVPPEHVSVLLGWLKPAEYIRKPWRLEWLAELGYISIRTHDGRELRVRFFDAGHNPAVLTVDGVSQFYGRNEMVDFGGEPRPIFGGITLAAAVYRAHKAIQR